MIAWFRRSRLDAEMAAEMRHHVELQTELNRRAGLSSEEARYAALRQFGNVAVIQEQVRAARSWIWLEQCWQDARYAVRTLRKAPGFTTVVVLTLALGIGLNTVVFSFYHTLTGKPLAVRDPGAILRVSADARQFQSPFTHGEYEELRGRLQSVEALVAASPLQVLLVAKTGAADERQEAAAVQLVSGNYFSALGVQALRGRTFAPGEPDSAVLSYIAWRQRFNGDRTVVGRTVQLQGVPVVIVGVAPERFGGTSPPAAPDFWVPMTLQPRLLPNVDWLRDPTVRVWQLLARRGAQQTTDQVGAELATAVRSWRQPDGKPLQSRVRVATFFQLEGPQVHAVGVTLLLTVGLILLVGCINVVNLMFARNAAREHELAVRLALGAGRGRLLRQLCTESLLLGLASGLAGFGFAWWSCGVLGNWATTTMREITRSTWSPFLEITPDASVFVYSLAVALVVGLLVGLRPAWQGAGVGVGAALKRHATGQAGRGIFGARNRLLAVQIAASLLLLAGAGLLLRGASRALNTDPGFDAKHLLSVVAWSNLPGATPNPAEQARRAREIDVRLRTVPGIVAVTGADRVPFAGHSVTAYVTDEGKWVKDCVVMQVDADYFTTLGLTLVAGRPFLAQEAADTSKVVIITQSAARHLWPGMDPLGRRIMAPKSGGVGNPEKQYTVVGVVQDARFTLLSKTDAVDLFFPQAASSLWLLRTQGAPEMSIPSVYAALRGLDPVLAAQTAVWTMEEGPMRVQRLLADVPANFASLLGAIALALAAVGIFGVVSFAVARRTREIGIRLALGAQDKEVVLLVLRQTLQPVVWGAALGLVGAVGLSILLAKLVLSAELPDLTYGAGAFPVATFGGALGVLLGVILLAAWLPARRAAKVDPMVALRAE
jgi:predicted permease